METAHFPHYVNPALVVEKRPQISVTRGAINRYFKLLEEQVAVTLFQWLPRGFELTEPGRRFLPMLMGAFESIGHRTRLMKVGRSENGRSLSDPRHGGQGSGYGRRRIFGDVVLICDEFEKGLPVMPFKEL